MEHDDLAKKVPAGSLMSFPTTPFTPKDRVDLDVLAQHVEIQLSYGARAVFPGCGTGEMQSLSPEEHVRVVAAVVDVVNGRVPVFAGVGFGLAASRQMVSVAAEAGADGALVFPPYLAPGDENALLDYYATIAAAAPVDFGLIIYQRDGQSLPPEGLKRLARIRNVVGLKDGNGLVDVMQQQVAAVEGAEFLFFNGTPTAELYAPALASIGVPSYSSALLNMIPEFAAAFNAAAARGDSQAIRQLTDRVVLPFTLLRDRVPGYAISLVKEAVQMRGIPVGKVRVPLPAPREEDRKDLQAFLEGIGLFSDLMPCQNANERADWRPNASDSKI
ncbi:5-dehydro-4-deoxyglucarate dehydratase [Ornithinimicrobium murale]|uniref:5-dehydro-4-deoxyglucarate dehydratase n=1 Tax=Ornithinimicrobium murale TaxID=1050153 RepID=UPI0013B40497|nr:5-dehydro-4-deoxyglucarate dehydratase [Ornithinimicrobium murale]